MSDTRSKVKLKLTTEEMELLVGEECDDFHPGCCVCQEWERYYKGRYTAITIPKKIRDSIIRYSNGEVV